MKAVRAAGDLLVLTPSPPLLEAMSRRRRRPPPQGRAEKAQAQPSQSILSSSREQEKGREKWMAKAGQIGHCEF